MQLSSVMFVIAISYIIGSFPTAYLVARTRGVDIFKVGSGNMGATNVIRACGFRYGLIVWAWDVFKGILTILIARWLIPENPTAASVLAAVAAVAGHNWSFLATVLTGSIRGGKGAATATGTFVLLAPTLLVAVILALGAAIVLLTRYVSLGVLISAAAAGAAIVLLVGLGQMEPVYSVYLLVCYMIFLRHRNNIYNLLAGKERRLGDRI